MRHSVEVNAETFRFCETQICFEILLPNFLDPSNLCFGEEKLRSSDSIISVAFIVSYAPLVNGKCLQLLVPSWESSGLNDIFAS